MITHVAIKCSNGRIYSLPRPNRHHHVINEINQIFGKNSASNILADHEQGFLKNNDIFLNRTEAFQHAAECRQIKKELYSEDLW